MKINIKYIAAFLGLFAIEVFIALFVHIKIIRNYIGDALVVILMYTFIKAVVKRHIRFLPIYIVAFASAVEVSQYYHLVNILHLENNKFMSIIMGNTFDLEDILCYSIGGVILILWEVVGDMNQKLKRKYEK